MVLYMLYTLRGFGFTWTRRHAWLSDEVHSPLVIRTGQFSSCCSSRTRRAFPSFRISLSVPVMSDLPRLKWLSSERKTRHKTNMYRIFCEDRRRTLLVRRPTVIRDRYAPILVRVSYLIFFILFEEGRWPIHSGYFIHKWCQQSMCSICWTISRLLIFGRTTAAAASSLILSAPWKTVLLCSLYSVLSVLVPGA